jgi:hypothetical protein
VIEFRVQYADYASEKTGAELPAEDVMSLEEARQWIAAHPTTEYVVLRRTRQQGGEPSLWEVYLAPVSGCC